MVASDAEASADAPTRRGDEAAAVASAGAIGGSAAEAEDDSSQSDPRLRRLSTATDGDDSSDSDEDEDGDDDDEEDAGARVTASPVTSRSPPTSTSPPPVQRVDSFVNALAAAAPAPARVSAIDGPTVPRPLHAGKPSELFRYSFNTAFFHLDDDRAGKGVHRFFRADIDQDKRTKSLWRIPSGLHCDVTYEIKSGAAAHVARSARQALAAVERQREGDGAGIGNDVSLEMPSTPAVGEVVADDSSAQNAPSSDAGETTAVGVEDAREQEAVGDSTVVESPGMDTASAAD